MEHKIQYKPIGIIHSPFKEVKGTPIQPTGAKGIDGSVIVFPEYTQGLKDIEGFSHIILLYHFHLSGKPSLMVTPFMDSIQRGVFATRSPRRPNPIGLSVLRLIGIEENILHIQDIDIIDGTPLLDIKPYVPDFDIREVHRFGWLENNIHKLLDAKDDGRFSKEKIQTEHGGNQNDVCRLMNKKMEVTEKLPQKRKSRSRQGKE